MTPKQPTRCPYDQGTLEPLIIQKTPIPHFGCLKCRRVMRFYDGELAMCEFPEEHLAPVEKEWLGLKSYPNPARK